MPATRLCPWVMGLAFAYRFVPLVMGLIGTGATLRLVSRASPCGFTVQPCLDGYLSIMDNGSIVMIRS